MPGARMIRGPIRVWICAPEARNRFAAMWFRTRWSAHRECMGVFRRPVRDLGKRPKTGATRGASISGVDTSVSPGRFCETRGASEFDLGFCSRDVSCVGSMGFWAVPERRIGALGRLVRHRPRTRASECSGVGDAPGRRRKALTWSFRISSLPPAGRHRTPERSEQGGRAKPDRPGVQWRLGHPVSEVDTHTPHGYDRWGQGSPPVSARGYQPEAPGVPSRDAVVWAGR